MVLKCHGYADYVYDVWCDEHMRAFRGLQRTATGPSFSIAVFRNFVGRAWGSTVHTQRAMCPQLNVISNHFLPSANPQQAYDNRQNSRRKNLTTRKSPPAKAQLNLRPSNYPRETQAVPALATCCLMNFVLATHVSRFEIIRAGIMSCQAEKDCHNKASRKQRFLTRPLVTKTAAWAC